MANLPDKTSKEKHATFSFEMTRCDYYGNYTQKSQRNQELFWGSYNGSYLQPQKPTAMQNSDWLASDHVSDSSQ